MQNKKPRLVPAVFKFLEDYSRSRDRDEKAVILNEHLERAHI